MSDPMNGLVPVDQAVALPPVERHEGFLWDPTVGARQVWTNVNLETSHGRRLIQRMRAKADKAGGDVIGQLLQVVNAMVMEVTLTKQDGGEVISLPRVSLATAEGLTVAFCSMGAYESLRFILSIYGQGPWEPPLPVRVLQVSTRSGFRTYELLVEEADAPAGPSARKEGKRGSQ